MIKSFLFLALLLTGMVITVGIHMLTYPYDDHSRILKSLTKLTNYSELSFSLAYDDTPMNATYPEMPRLGRMDFVYER